ncbi:MAG: ABC transporter permease [bacterium]|nr:ABC transporter permease [bacterium]
MQAFLHDIRYALKSLRNQPRFVITAAITLAIGIGATTAIFTVLKSVVLEPLPYEGAGRLVKLNYDESGSDGDHNYFTLPDFRDIRARTESFEHVACYRDYSEMGFELTGKGRQPRRVIMMPVSANYFAALGAEPMVGRPFSREDERVDNPNIVISHRLWQDHLLGDANAVGQSLLLDRKPYSIIGIMPASFEEPFGRRVDLWIPGDLSVANDNSRYNFYLSVIGRLKPGVSLTEAQAEMDTIVAGIAEENRDMEGLGNWRARSVELDEEVVGGSGALLIILLAAVAVLMLIACVNVANLSLANSAGRQRELALRVSLGASRARIIRQLVIEHALVFLIGGAAGVLLAWAGVALLLDLRPDAVPRLDTIQLDGIVLGFATVLSLATGIVFGLVPAFRFSRGNLEQSLRDSSRSSSAGRSQSSLRRALVVSQIGLAFILLAGAALLLQSFIRMARVDPGFESDGVATFDLALPTEAYSVDEPALRVELERELQTRLESLPGVRAVGMVSRLPLTGHYHSWAYRIEREQIEGEGDVYHLLNFRVVGGDYFSALGVDLLEGRYFDSQDVMESTPTVIINRSMVELRFADVRPIGERIYIGGAWREIVGVVKNTRTGLRSEVPERAYVSYNQFANDRNWTMAHVVAADLDRTQLFTAIRKELAAIDPSLVMFNPAALDDVVEEARAREGFASLLMTVFAGVALVLSLVGVYGVLSYAVSQRSQEIGIRIALGAHRSQIGFAVVAEGVKLILVAVVVGTVCGIGLTRWLRSLLFEINAADPVTYAAVAVLLSLTSIVVCLIPAHAATRSNPMAVLRGE